MGIMNTNDINAANAGNCEFYVTNGLLRRASDDQLRGVLAHEIAHQDLGHVAKAQVLGAGLSIGAAVLQQTSLPLACWRRRRHADCARLWALGRI